MFGQGLCRDRSTWGWWGGLSRDMRNAEFHWVMCSGRFQAPRWASGHKQAQCLRYGPDTLERGWRGPWALVMGANDLRWGYWCQL